MDDFGMWRASRYLINRPHIAAYFNLLAITESQEDQDDHHALYAMQANRLNSQYSSGTS